MFLKLYVRIQNKRGMSTIEAVILIAVLLGVALLFRKYIIRFVELVFESIFKDAKNIIGDPDSNIPNSLG